jgi:hypothetical protein
MYRAYVLYAVALCFLAAGFYFGLVDAVTSASREVLIAIRKEQASRPWPEQQLAEFRQDAARDRTRPKTVWHREDKQLLQSSWYETLKRLGDFASDIWGLLKALLYSAAVIVPWLLAQGVGVFVGAAKGLYAGFSGLRFSEALSLLGTVTSVSIAAIALRIQILNRRDAQQARELGARPPSAGERGA